MRIILLTCLALLFSIPIYAGEWIIDNKSASGIIKDKYDELIKEKKKIEEVHIKLVLELQAKDKLLQQKKRIIRKNIEEIKKKKEIIEKLKALDVKLENHRVDTD